MEAFLLLGFFCAALSFVCLVKGLKRSKQIDRLNLESDENARQIVKLERRIKEIEK